MVNFKHLHYFWAVAKYGGVNRASELLHITPQTISGQISILEDQLGKSLFKKVGRKLELTDTGKRAMSYADEIFALGSELEESLHQQSADRPLTFRVGIADVVPKSIAYRLLSPVLELPEQVRLICRESNTENLLADLAVHRVDLVVADTAIPENINVNGYSYSLGECGVTFLATPNLAAKLQSNFPDNLNNSPMLVPSDTNILRSRLDAWLNSNRVYPKIVGEYDDSALMKTFGQAGAGIFPVPTAIAEEVINQFRFKQIGQTDEVRESFFAISTVRRDVHPALAAITDKAKTWL